MLLTNHKIERPNYQLVRVLIALKCKLKKVHEPIKSLFITRISGTLDYTAAFTSAKTISLIFSCGSCVCL